METFLTLSMVDRQILNSYKIMADGLGNYLGQNYEIILHSLENLEESVLKIINGHFSNRKEGAPITDLALNMLTDLSENPKKPIIPYFNRGRNGAFLKSCTIPISGENERIIGLLCINLHLEMPLIDYLNDLFPHADKNHEDAADYPTISENFSENISELILNAALEVKNIVHSNPEITSANQNKEIILELDKRGIFKLKDSVIKVAGFLGISKNTVYMHLRNQKKMQN